MKIYLAGVNERDPTRTHWRYRLTIGECERVVAGFWEVQKKAILGAYHYTGPFIRNERAVRLELPGTCYKEHELRIAAIRSSDIVFTWEPDALALWELGVARGSSVVTAVGYTPDSGKCFDSIDINYSVASESAPTALLEVLRQFQNSNHFFNGVWRKMVSKFGSPCIICGDAVEMGEDIMWRKKNEEARGGEVCHVECFVLNAPPNKMDQSLQDAGMELLRKRVRKVEEENSRLLETIQDLA